MQNRKVKSWKYHGNSLFKRCENWILWYAYLQPFPAVMFAFGVLDVGTQTEKFRKSYESHEDFLPDTRVGEVTVHFGPL